MNPKVSVIVPVYKAEKYIDECLESILDQDYDNLELVLVDDGSPDRCPQICDEYAQKDKRIKVIHKKNSGPGFSRDAGVDNCSGDFVTFVDSDDKLDDVTAISSMVKVALLQNSDVVVGCYRRFDSDYVSEVNHHHLQNSENKESLDFRFRGFFQYGHLAYDWGKLYRKSFLIVNDLRHGKFPIAEDKEFNFRVYACNPKMYCLDSSVYCYRVNVNSLTSKYMDDFTSVWTSVSMAFRKYLRTNKINRKIMDLSAFHVFFGSFFLIKQELQSGKNIIESSKELRKYAENPCAKKMMKDIISKNYTKGIKSTSWRYVIWGATLLFNLHMYLLFTMGIALIRKMGMDEQITKRRYKKGDRNEKI